MAETGSNAGKPERKDRMDSAIFDVFARLANESDSARIDAGVSLLRHLHQHGLDETDDKEGKYALTRIIRSLGSTKVHYRKGSYTTLTVFLTMHPETSVDKILAIVDNELHATSDSKCGNGSVYTGRLLVYGALIRSKILLESNMDSQLEILEKLIHAGKQRSYLSFMSVSFLVEYLNQIESNESAKGAVWPILEKEFGKPWSEQTLDTLYILLMMKDRFPKLCNSKFLKRHLNADNIVSKETMEDAVKVLTDLPRIVSCHHPIYKLFCEKLTTAELITEFWSCIDQRFKKPSKSDEHLAVEILKLILENITDKSLLPSLLSQHFLQHMLRRFSSCKRHESDEVLRAFKDILNMLVSCVNNKDVKVKTQISVLKKLILYPGDLMIEKKTGTKVVQLITGHMTLEGIKKVSKIYRDIAENTLVKEQQNVKAESPWTNAERMYAVQLLTRLMGHPASLTDHDWRLDQLKFLFSYGLCEISNVGADLASSLKESFYRALDYKLPKLSDLRNILSALVHHLNSKLNSKTLKLRIALSDEAQNAWKKVVQVIEKMEHNSKKSEIFPVFHTMNLHMGLQLFSDPDMAIMSINELQSCYERITKKSKRGKGKTDDEPEWVEVVIDLLLSLLSRNNHLLRSLVGCVFPHICSYITPTAIHEILAVLDIKNDKGPLVAQNGIDDDESSDKELMDEESSTDDDDKDNVEHEDSREEDESSDGESDSGSNDETANEDNDEDETVTDRLRLAVRQALGDASVQTDDEDIDVDEIDEDEGKRLDESLAAAFRILRENRQSRTKKQEKTAQTVMHFRIRVIDLLDIYLDTDPSMAIVLDMIVPLFALLEYCIKDPHQTPLQHRVRSCLKKLSNVKKFRDIKDVDDEVLTVVLKSLIEKGERTTSVCQEMNDKLAQCCTFLIRCSQQANLSIDAIVQIFGENLTAFFKKRDCILPPTLFKNILQLQWEGNWHLAPLLVDFAFDSTVRSFRRGHALEFLIIFYNNGRLVRSDTEHIEIKTKLEKQLYKNSLNMFNELSTDKVRSMNANHEIGKEVRQRFVCLLLTLLRTVYMQHVPQAWNWKTLGSALTSYRSSALFAKDTRSAYNKLAGQIGLTTHSSARKVQSKQPCSTNGQVTDSDTEEASNITQENGNTESEDEATDTVVSSTSKKDKKKSKLLKKEARLLREKKMSEGFTEFRFSSYVVPEKIDESTTHRNGDSPNDESSIKSPQKRPLSHSKELGNKPKRKKSLQTA